MSHETLETVVKVFLSGLPPIHPEAIQHNGPIVAFITYKSTVQEEQAFHEQGAGLAPECCPEKNLDEQR
jgi:hypothetical protein